MNTMIFLGGLGVGAFIASIIFLIIIRVVAGRRAADANAANLHELKRRNDIGEDQCHSLRTMANWCDLNMERKTGVAGSYH